MSRKGEDDTQDNEGFDRLDPVFFFMQAYFSQKIVLQTRRSRFKKKKKLNRQQQTSKTTPINALMLFPYGFLNDVNFERYALLTRSGFK